MERRKLTCQKEVSIRPDYCSGMQTFRVMITTNIFLFHFEFPLVECSINDVLIIYIMISFCLRYPQLTDPKVIPFNSIMFASEALQCRCLLNWFYET